MKKRGVLVVVGISIVLSLQSGCSYLRKTWRTEDVLFEHSWVLCNIKGNRIDIAYFKEGVPYIKLDTMGNVLIYTGCDFIFGEYIFEEDDSINFKFDQDGFCLGPVGENFITGLKNANRLQIVKEKLLLMDSDSVVMTFFCK